VTDYAINGAPAAASVGGGASLSDATPAALGTAAAGVSTSASRADHVHEAPAGGTTHTSGTLAARPVSPAAGDTYAVTSGASTGARYVCFVTGSWEGTVPFATGHSYERLAPATAGGGARFLDVDSLQAYTSSGDDAVRWGVELPGGLGPDAAGLTHGGGMLYAAAQSLTAYTRNNTTLAVLFDWIGPSVAQYNNVCTLGDRTTGSIEIFIEKVGANDQLIVYNHGAITPITTLRTFTGGLAAGIHRVTVAPITGDLYRWSFDGSAIADTAMASAWNALPASGYVGLGTSALPDTPPPARSIDLIVWPSLLSSPDLVALSTAPGTETYRLAEDASTGVGAIRVEANRYDPTFPLVLPARGLTVPMAVGAAVRKYAYP